MTAIQDIPLVRLDGAADTLATHKGKVLLIRERRLQSAG